MNIINKFCRAALCLSTFWFSGYAFSKSFSLEKATIEDINEAFDSGALNAEKLVSMYLKRIEAYDKIGPRINTVITLQPNAIEIARKLDIERSESGPRSKLHGIPVVLKDLFDTYDMPTSSGFLPLKDSQPLYDATVVKRLREAGAIIFAKVNMSDWFGSPTDPKDQSSVLGRTNNPYNLELTPGGSSGGTGAALAAVFAQIGLGLSLIHISEPTRPY